MTGRYVLEATGLRLLEHFDALPGDNGVAEFAGRFNIAPTQRLPIVRASPGGPEIALVQWGFTPHRAHGSKPTSPVFNARAERILTQPTFHAALGRRRCLIPATGYYEWKIDERSTPSSRRPYLIAQRERRLIAFAGLWEVHVDTSGASTPRFVIITTAANAVVKPIHDRMPVIVAPEHYSRWLGIDHDPAFVLTLVESAAAAALIAVPVSNAVNNAAHDSPACVQPDDESR